MMPNVIQVNHSVLNLDWIPAFAGMTVYECFCYDLKRLLYLAKCSIKVNAC